MILYSVHLDSYLAKLNPAQRQAVEALEGPVLVVAGPGTGKTQILATRIANILAKTDASASNILCLTFTESGVVAMRDRLRQIIGNDAYQVRIHTFHSFAGEVIQSFPEKFAFSRELLQLDDLTRVKIIREILDGLDAEKTYELRPFYNPYAYQSDIISAIQNLKKEGWEPEAFGKLCAAHLQAITDSPDINPKTGKPKATWLTAQKQALKNVELAELYTAYQSRLQDGGLYDYEDMILFVIKQFGADDELLAHYQERYLYVLVDEYQDTNGAQNQILELLGNFDSAPNIFAVGDDDQAIYRFQGANVENILFFTKKFDNVHTIAITENYRSTQQILDAASSVISRNAERLTNILPDLSKDLISAAGTAGEKVELTELHTLSAEDDFIVGRIKELQADKVPLSQIAILYRKHSDADSLIDALLHAGIPISLSAGRDSLADVKVSQLLKLLRVIDYASADRDFLLFQVLFFDFLHLPRLDVFRLVRLAKQARQSIFELMTDEDALTTAGIEQPELFSHLAQQIVEWKALDANLPLSIFIERVGRESGFLQSVFTDQAADLDNMNAVKSFYHYVKRLNTLNSELKLTGLLADIELLSENRLGIKTEELESDQEGVQLLTAHGAKGLEFEHVFLIRAYDGNWGGRRSRQMIRLPDEIYQSADSQAAAIDTATEDERRLFYVAMTRAKLQLHITYARIYPSGNDTKEVSPSQFVGEIAPELVQTNVADDADDFDAESILQSLSPVEIKPYSQVEADYLQQVVSEFKLSASSLNEYIECPLKFKFNRLLQVPKPPEKNLALGTAVHYALEQYFRKLMQGEQADLQFVLDNFNHAIYKELLEPEDKQAAITEGRKLLTGYFDYYQTNFEVPVDVEYGFAGREIVLENKNDTTKNINNDPILLTGKIDKITWVDEGRSLVRVTDYKTSSPKSANEIRGLTKNSEGNIYRQLVFYKLLAELDDRFRPSPAAPKYQIVEVEVDFIKPNSGGKFKREVFEITDSDVEDLKLEIYDVMRRVRNLEFTGSDKYPLCGECEYCLMFRR